jgi:hypothetical protein
MSRPGYPGPCGESRDANSPISSITVSASLSVERYGCHVSGSTYTPFVQFASAGSGSATYTRVRWTGSTPPTLGANQFYMIEPCCGGFPQFVFAGDIQGATAPTTVSTCTEYNYGGGTAGTCTGAFTFGFSLFYNGDGTYHLELDASTGFPSGPGSICAACNSSAGYAETPSVTVALASLAGTHSFSDSQSYSGCPPVPLTQPYNVSFSGSVAIS